MEIISDNLFEEIIRNGTYNLIGFAITPWHAHGIDCCVELLRQKGIEVNGLVIIGYNIQSGYVINSSHFVNEKVLTFYYGQKKINYHNIIKNLIYRTYCVWKYKKPSNLPANFYIASAWHLNLETYKTILRINPKANVEFIKFEEGLATYFPTSDSYKSIWTSIKSSNTFIKILKYSFRYMDKYTMKQFEKKVRFTNLNLFLESRHELIPNTNSINLYRNILNQRLQIQTKEIDTSVFENSIIVCSMAYPRNEIDNMEDVKVLQKVIQRYKQLGYKVILKPHPRENDIENQYANIGCEIFSQKDITLESILYHVKSVSAIVSFSSTTLITAKLLFGLRSICLLKLTDMHKYGNTIKMEMESFISCFSNMVEMPLDITELK